MKQRTAVQNSDRKQANARLAAGSPSRHEAERIAGWPARRTPRRHGKQQSRATKAIPIAEPRPNETEPRLSEQEWQCMVRSGTAPRQILKAAEEFEAELVVMPTRGLSHAPPVEVGSTAERVVRHAACPVLVLPTTKLGRKRKDSIDELT